MNCETCRDWIALLADRRLEAADAGRLSDHLAGCPDCRRHQERFEAADALLRRYEPTTLPDGFEDRVLAAARREPPPRRRFSLLPLLASAVAASVAAGIFLLATRPVGSAELQAAVDNHAARAASLSAAVESLPVGAPDVERAVAIESARLLDLQAQNRDVLSLPLERLNNGAQVRAHAQSVARLLKSIEQGRLGEARKEATYLRQVAPKPTVTWRAALAPPDTESALARLAYGRLALADGQYDVAVNVLSTAAVRAAKADQRIAATLWLSDAYAKIGKPEKALLTLVSCKADAEDAIRPRLKAFADSQTLYINSEPLNSLFLETWTADPKATYAIKTQEPQTWCYIAPSDAPAMTTLQFHAKDLELRFEEAEPYTAVWYKPNQLSRLPPSDLKWVRTLQAVDVTTTR